VLAATRPRHSSARQKKGWYRLTCARGGRTGPEGGWQTQTTKNKNQKQKSKTKIENKNQKQKSKTKIKIKNQKQKSKKQK
jgi:hypothetical protein